MNVDGHNYELYIWDNLAILYRDGEAVVTKNTNSLEEGIGWARTFYPDVEITVAS